MDHKQHPSRRQFLQTAGAAGAAALAVPYFVPASSLGADGRAAPSERIVMGGIGIGNMGGGDQGAFLGRNDVQYVAVCDVRGPHATGAKGKVNARYQEQRLQGLQRFPRAAGPPRHRRRARGHARSLARDHGDRGLPQRQGRLLPEARDADAPRRAADGRGGPALRPRGFRRQPAGAGRLSSRLVAKCWGGELGTIKSINVNVGPLSKPVQPAGRSGARQTWTGTCGWGPRPGRRTTRGVATATLAPAAAVGGRTSIIPAAA